jgi:flavin-dependent dehydrogenase
LDKNSAIQSDLRESYDVVVVGAGLAGLQCARLLAGHGLGVLLVDRKPSLEQGVHTTGIFVRRSLEDFSLPPAYLGPPIRHVTLYSPARRRLELESGHDEFRIGKMGPLYVRSLSDCQAAGATWLPATSYLGSEATAEGSRVSLRVSGREVCVQARYLVGADGAQSRVAADLGLSVNERWIVGLEDVFEGAPLSEPPRLHVFLDDRLAPGYIGWMAQDGQSAHLGVGGYPTRFQPAAALDRFREIAAAVVPLDSARLTERRGGRIPVGSILPCIANERGLLVGDAAGAVSPLTAGGLDPCLRLSELAAKVVWKFVTTRDPAVLACYDGRAFRAKFRARRALRRAFDLLGRNLVLETACAMLRLPGGRGIARRIFFGRGSFPDFSEAAAALRPSALQPQKRQAVAVN